MSKEFEEKQACVIAEAMEYANELNNQRLIEKLATKEDIIELKTGVSDLTTNMSNLESRIEARIIKWTFVFIMGQFWAIAGVLFVFFRK